MAVFNSCRGAYGDSSDLAEDSRERNLTEALVKRGIPAVLAMAERIPDDVALTLTQLFYRNLNQGYPVDLSLSRARAGLISAYGSHQLYWALPILYQHPEFDGYLTGKSTQSAAGDSRVQNFMATGLPIAGAEGRHRKSWMGLLKLRNYQFIADRPDIPDGKGGDDSPARIQEHDPLSGTNSLISTSSPKVASGRSTRAAVPQAKPLKKSGLKKCLTVTLCLLSVALGAGFLGWRHSQQKSRNPKSYCRRYGVPCRKITYKPSR